MSSNAGIRFVENLDISWRMVIFGIAINSLILYLFSDIILFLGSSLAFILILIFLILNDKTKLSDEGYIKKSRDSSFFDAVGMIRQYFSLNKRFILASSIGLIIALLIISQSSIMSSSYQQHTFSEFTQSSDPRSYVFEIDNVDYPEYLSWNSYLEDNAQDWLNQHDYSLNKLVSYGTISAGLMFEEGATPGTRFIYHETIVTKQWTKEYYDLLADLPDFPDIEYNPGDSFLLMPKTVTFQNPEFGTDTYNTKDFVKYNGTHYEFNLLTDHDTKFLGSVRYDLPFNNITYYADHLWTWTSAAFNYPFENELTYPESFLIGTLFVPDEQEWDLLEKLEESSEQVDSYRYTDIGTRGIDSYIKINLPLIFETDPNELKLQVNDIFDVIFDDVFDRFQNLTIFDPSDVLDHDVFSPLSVILDDYLADEAQLQQIVQISSFPLIIISLFLFYFALKLNEKRKDEQIRKMKVRGASNSQIRTILGAEILFYSVIASIIGTLLSIALSWFMLSNTELFNSSIGGIKMYIPSDLYWRIPLLGLLFSIDFNLFYLDHVSKVGEEDTALHKKRTVSFWEENNIDLLLFFFALTYWVFSFTNVQFVSSKFHNQYLGYLAMALTLLSLPLVISRYFIPFIEFIVNKLPFKFDNLILSIKAIIRNRDFSNKLLGLVLLAMIFTSLGMITSTTIVETNDDLTYYTIGSDMYVQNIDDSNMTEWDMLSVDGVKEVSQIQTTEIESDVPITTIDLDPKTFKFTAIDPNNFGQVTYWKNHFADDTLDNLLENITQPNSVLVQKQIGEAMEYFPGISFNLLYGTNNQHNYSLKVVNTFEYFPRLIFREFSDTLDKSEVNEIELITSIENLKQITTILPIGIKVSGALIKLEDGADVDKVADEIYDSLNYIDHLRIYTYNDNRISLFQSNRITTNPFVKFEELFLMSSLNLILIFSMIINIIGLIYFSFIIINEQKREVGVYRSLGMIHKQIFRIILLEVLLIVALSIILGIIIGVGLSTRIFNILLGRKISTIPEFKITVPYVLIIGYNTVMVLIGAIFAYIPSRIMSSRETGNILREN